MWLMKNQIGLTGGLILDQGDIFGVFSHNFVNFFYNVAQKVNIFGNIFNLRPKDQFELSSPVFDC
jgi:hypothetical protein